VVHAKSIMAGLGHKARLGVLEVKNCVVGNWETSHVHVVHLVDKWLVEGLAAEDGKDAEPVLGHDVEDVLVKRIADYFCVASVSLSSVNEQ